MTSFDRRDCNSLISVTGGGQNAYANPGFGRPNPGFGRPNPRFGRRNPGFGCQILGLDVQIKDLDVQINDLMSKSLIWTSKPWIRISNSRFGRQILGLGSQIQNLDVQTQDLIVASKRLVSRVSFHLCWTSSLHFGPHFKPTIGQTNPLVLLDPYILPKPLDQV